MAIETQAKLYTTAEAAKRLGLAVDTVRQYIHRGLIKPATKIGHWHLVSEEECQRYEKDKAPAGNPNLVKKPARRRRNTRK